MVGLCVIIVFEFITSPLLLLGEEVQHRIYPKDARNLYGPRLVRASAHKYFVREPKPRTAEIIFEISQKHEFSKPGQVIPQPCFFTDKIVLTSLARVFRSDYCGVLFGEYYHRRNRRFPYWKAHHLLFQIKLQFYLKHLLIYQVLRV